jgi:hypothetical protein
MNNKNKTIMELQFTQDKLGMIKQFIESNKITPQDYFDHIHNAYVCRRMITNKEELDYLFSIGFSFKEHGRNAISDKVLRDCVEYDGAIDEIIKDYHMTKNREWVDVLAKHLKPNKIDNKFYPYQLIEIRKARGKSDLDNAIFETLINHKINNIHDFQNLCSSLTIDYKEEYLEKIKEKFYKNQYLSFGNLCLSLTLLKSNLNIVNERPIDEAFNEFHQNVLNRVLYKKTSVQNILGEFLTDDFIDDDMIDLIVKLTKIKVSGNVPVFESASTDNLTLKTLEKLAIKMGDYLVFEPQRYIQALKKRYTPKAKIYLPYYVDSWKITPENANEMVDFITTRKDFETFFKSDEAHGVIDELDKHTNGRMREWINKITPKQQTQQRKFGL